VRKTAISLFLSFSHFLSRLPTVRSLSSRHPRHHMLRPSHHTTPHHTTLKNDCNSCTSPTLGLASPAFPQRLHYAVLYRAAAVSCTLLHYVALYCLVRSCCALHYTVLYPPRRSPMPVPWMPDMGYGCPSPRDQNSWVKGMENASESEGAMRRQ
jgi:hypothetical protein